MNRHSNGVTRGRPCFRTLCLAALSIGLATTGGCVIVVDDTGEWHDSSDYRGESRRPRIGVEIDNVGPALAEQLGIDRHRATLIESVYSNSPAARAGLQRWDVITQIDGRDSASPSDLRRAIRDKGWNGTLALRVIRSGQPLDVEVKIDEPGSPRSHYDR